MQTADYNKDQKLDIFLQNQQTNRVAVWIMDQSKVVAIESLPSIDDKNWKIAAVDDFNGDSNFDILWTFKDQDKSKTLLWLMQDDQILEQQWIEIDIQELHNWNIIGTGDFDNNTVPDLVLNYIGKDPQLIGAIFVNYLEGKNRIQTKESKTTDWLPWDNNITSELQTVKDPVAIVDFNQDGFDDLIFRKNEFNPVKSELGNIEVWLMKDIERVSIIDIPSTLKENWTPIFADLNKDFATDIIWQNIDLADQLCQGRTSYWEMTRIDRLKTTIKQDYPGC